MKAIRKAPVTFGYMELCQIRARKGQYVRAFVRGSNDGLRLNACSACVKNHVTCHTQAHVHS